MAPNTTLERRTMLLADRRTTVALQRIEWVMLEEVAVREDVTVKFLIYRAEAIRGPSSIPSALRLMLLRYWRGTESGVADPFGFVRA
jgi:predicted DNA-binding ribbon-helix-helix protein